MNKDHTNQEYIQNITFAQIMKITMKNSER
jgi:hypothetical protein